MAGPFTKTAVQVFAGTDAAGNARQVNNHDAQTWGTEVERMFALFQAGGGVIFSSKADADNNLDYPGNTMAWVINDSIAANNGIYDKRGASGTGEWVRVGDLPYSFIRAENAGAGTANAIQATTTMPIPQADGGALIALPIAVDNTADAPTVSFNGGPALTISDAAGNPVSAGGLSAGMLINGYKVGDTFRADMGPRGWSPLERMVSDGARRVREVYDWTGGHGAKPSETGYVGPSGLTSDIAQATDVRGPAGPSGDGTGDMVASVYDPQSRGADAFEVDNFTVGGEPVTEIGKEILKAPDELSARGPLGIPADRPYVILCTGQSNVAANRDYAWSPPDNLFLWDWNGFAGQNMAGDVGTKFDPMPNDIIGFGHSYAAQVALANPTRRVYLINIGRGSKAIAQWLPGATGEDMYAACKDNVEAALPLIEADHIDEMVWWQGESDFVDGNLNYVTDFEQVVARFRGESWFPYNTHWTVAGITERNQNNPDLRYFNNTLRRAVYLEPMNRTFANTGTLPYDPFWLDGGNGMHMSAIGYKVAGEMAYQQTHWNAQPGFKSATPWQTVMKTGQESRSNTTTLEDDPELQVYLVNGREFRIRGTISLIVPADAGFKWGFSGPATGAVTDFYVESSGTHKQNLSTQFFHCVSRQSGSRYELGHGQRSRKNIIRGHHPPYGRWVFEIPVGSGDQLCYRLDTTGRKLSGVPRRRDIPIALPNGP